MCSSTPEVGQEGQEFNAPLGYIRDLRLFYKKENLSQKTKHFSDNDEYCYCY